MLFKLNLFVFEYPDIYKSPFFINDIIIPSVSDAGHQFMRTEDAQTSIAESVPVLI